MEEGGRIRQSEIATRLLKQLKNAGADEHDGYTLAVTELVSIGRGMLGCSEHIIFPVTFRSRTFVPQKGDVMIGTVHLAWNRGVFLKCGPMRHIYLASVKMGDYSYVEGEKPFFLSGDQDRIEEDSVIRFKVLAARFPPKGPRPKFPRHFMILAAIDESSLGPIQSAGADAMDLETVCPV